MKFRNTFTRFLPLLGCALVISCQEPEHGGEAVKQPEEAVVLTTEERMANLQNDLKAVKADLTTDGQYNCCVQPACDWCLLHEGNCGCYANLKANKEVCPGCGLGWHNGKGVVPVVKTSQVKWNITHEHPKEGGHKH